MKHTVVEKDDESSNEHVENVSVAKDLIYLEEFFEFSTSEISKVDVINCKDFSAILLFILPMKHVGYKV